MSQPPYPPPYPPPGSPPYPYPYAYPPPPPTPPQPPARRTPPLLRLWYRLGGLPLYVQLPAGALVGMTLVTVMILVFANESGLLHPRQPSTAPTSGTVFRTPAPTVSAPTTTPATGPQLISAAILGGTQDAFTAAFGAPAAESPPRYIVVASGGVTIEVSYADTQMGTDGQPRVDLLMFGSSDATWAQSASARLTIIQQFFPPDARHVRDDSDPQLGPLHVYQSADLAASFPAAVFRNTNDGSLLPAGTFTVACEQSNGGACTIATGE